MKTQTIPYILVVALSVRAAPAPRATVQAVVVPLIFHPDGLFWSTSVQVEGSPVGGVDSALDTGGQLFFVPSSLSPPCEAGGCTRGTCK
jgi:hypothetical protein